MQRAVNALRATLPIVHQLLPLLGGTLGAAVSNVLGPHSQTAPHPTPINLEPIEDDLAELQTQHRDLRNRLLEHHASLKRVEDQLETVREATDRNAREQDELADDLQSIRKNVHRFAMTALALLVVSLLLNVGLFLHILHVLPWL
jgi:septal ring factor EnvC (AmiA/AmiB activator)